jgi:hypothetical protein
MLISYLESELDAVQMVAETARLIVSYFVNFFPVAGQVCILEPC